MTENISEASQDPTESCSLISCIPTLESIIIKKECFKVGRSICSDFVLKEKNVQTIFMSYLHFVITKDWDNTVWYITDFSKCGTYLNGTTLKKYRRKDLKDGDTIALGLKNYNAFIFRSSASPMKLSDSQIPKGSMGWGHLKSCMMYLESFNILNDEFKVGRSQKCDVVIDRTQIDQNIKYMFSNEHFIIFKDRDNALVFIRDLSTGGTYLNGRLIGKDNTNVLQNNDVISIGLNKLILFVYESKYLYNMSTYLPEELGQKYVISEFLGRGAAGEVSLALEKFSCKKVAIKKIMNSYPGVIKTDIDVLKTLSHPSIIKMRDIVKSPETVFIVLEYTEGGNLLNRISSNDPLSESNVKFLFYQVVLAVQFLHGKGITHGDLKPENVFLFSDDSETLVKVSDFALSTVTEGYNMMTTFFGLMNCIDNLVPDYGKEIDVWSLGVLLLYMLPKRIPFQLSHKSVLETLISTGSYIMEGSDWKGVSLSARNLVRKILNVNPQTRISIPAILKHPWLGKDLVMKCKVHSLLESHLDLKNSFENIIMTYGLGPPLKRIRLFKLWKVTNPTNDVKK